MKEIIPTERHETIRQEIVKLLQERSLAANALSKLTRRREKEIYSHLEQIKKSGALAIIPAECSDCGFKFKDRDRANKPGKCPKCKGTFITPPLFTMIGC